MQRTDGDFAPPETKGFEGLRFRALRVFTPEGRRGREIAGEKATKRRQREQVSLFKMKQNMGPFRVSGIGFRTGGLAVVPLPKNLF